MDAFWLCFVPLFVAVDGIGLLPMFLGITQGIEPRRLRLVIAQSVVTAAAVALAFLAAGSLVLKFLGITVADFMISGGVLLFVLSMSDLLTTQKTQRLVDLESVGAVPIGVPLITGPAVLTTSIILVNEHGPVLTSLAIIVNILIVGVLFFFAPAIQRFLGRAGAKTVSKITNLLLAAIAVMFIRRGVVEIITLGI